MFCYFYTCYYPHYFQTLPFYTMKPITPTSNSIAYFLAHALIVALLTLISIASSCTATRNYSAGDTVIHRHSSRMVYVLDSIQPRYRHNADRGKVWYAHTLAGQQTDYLPVSSYYLWQTDKR